MLRNLNLFVTENKYAVSFTLLALCAIGVVRLLRKNNQPTFSSLIVRLMYRWCRWCMSVTVAADSFINTYRNQLAQPLPPLIHNSGWHVPADDSMAYNAITPTQVMR